ncbi:MAG: DUF3010 family protein [Campylobacteraceae bacterium]|nr:DUF3010 family protein [Campylobacteraceae bacterium]
MKVCGIDLKASNAILAVIEKKDEESVFIPLEIKKIALDANDEQKEMIQFYDNISGFLKVNLINKVVIKKRAKKGNFSGGANTFKMEAAIQLSGICDVSLLSSQSISSYEKKNNVIFPKEIKKYQEAAYLTAICS